MQAVIIGIVRGKIQPESEIRLFSVLELVNVNSGVEVCVRYHSGGL